MRSEHSGFRFSVYISAGPEFQRNSSSSEKKKQKQLWSKKLTEWCPGPEVLAVPTSSQDVITGYNFLQSNYFCFQVLSRLKCIADLIEKRFNSTEPFWTLYKHKEVTVSGVPFIYPSQYLTEVVCPSSLNQAHWHLTSSHLCCSWPSPTPLSPIKLTHVWHRLRYQSLIHDQDQNIRVCFHGCTWLEPKKM